MREQEAVRRLVKSAPELWAQCSDPTSLARHLSGFGEIRITRLEPESTVAWEGESASGTVSLEASGWGTKVRLTVSAPSAAQPGGSAPQPRPLRILDGPPVRPRGLMSLIGTLRRQRREIPAAPAPAPPVTVTPQPAAGPSRLPELEAALDSLGSAHHRPYSRS